MRFTGLLAGVEACAKVGSVWNRDADRIRRIVPSPGISSGLGWPCRVSLVKARTPNAFCWSDGTITVSTGLLHDLKPTDVAFVIGHEMAHAIQRHARKQAGKNILLSFGAALSGWLFGLRAGDWTWPLGRLALPAHEPHR
jgi:Zn-dependent protease with chaperone function